MTAIRLLERITKLNAQNAYVWYNILSHNNLYIALFVSAIRLPERITKQLRKRTDCFFDVSSHNYQNIERLMSDNHLPNELLNQVRLARTNYKIRKCSVWDESSNVFGPSLNSYDLGKPFQWSYFQCCCNMITFSFESNYSCR